MTKKELINMLSDKLEVKKIEAERFFDTLEGIIEESIKKEEDITLGKLGTFKIKENAERQGVNPQTLEKITIPAKKVVKFKTSKHLNNLVK